MQPETNENLKALVRELPTAPLLWELVRLAPSFREGSGLLWANEELVAELPTENWPRALARLQQLEDDAGLEAVLVCLSEFAHTTPSVADACWFCGAPRGEAKQISGGSSFGIMPSARICARCVCDSAVNAEAPRAPPMHDALSIRLHCSFCARRIPDGLAARQSAYAMICRSCVELMLQILNEA